MKKLMIVLVILLAMVLGASCASADDADIFISDWANTENGLKADIERIDGELSVTVETLTGKELFIWQYNATYDEASNTLKATDGKKSSLTWKNGARIVGDAVYTDGTAVFSFDDEDQLIWKDEKEDAGKDLPMTDIGSFEGTWLHERTSIQITWSDDHYDVWIDWPESATEAYNWMLNGVYDAENEALNAYGTKTFFVYDDSGEVVSADEQNSEVNAEFTKVEEGKINWRDDDEGIDDMIFELEPNS